MRRAARQVCVDTVQQDSSRGCQHRSVITKGVCGGSKGYEHTQFMEQCDAQQVVAQRAQARTSAPTRPCSGSSATAMSVTGGRVSKASRLRVAGPHSAAKVAISAGTQAAS